MRLPNAVHESRPWRIREIAPDFTLEDVWALPVYGGAGDFPALLEVMTSRDLAREASPVTRLLFGARLLLGRWFGWDGLILLPGKTCALSDDYSSTTRL